MLENKIKEIIIKRYGSLSFFCKKIDVPYSTIDSILKRGIGKANVLNVIKICNELGISVDALKDGIIQPIEIDYITPKEFVIEVKTLLAKTSDITEKQKELLLSTLNFICSDN